MEKNLKILIVDGSRVSRKVIGKTLASEISAETMEITAVGSAAEAIELLANEKFDLITSALLLPDMYGIDLCKAVRKNQAHRFTPFIVVTAEPHERHMKEGFMAGVTDYYDKTRGFRNFVGFIRSFAERYAGLVGKVLYLEDNDTEAAATTAIMERHGLTVVRVVSAEHALKVIDGGFDLVVADFYLEDEMSGGDFLHNIRCGLRLSREQLPVLMTTGNDARDIQAEIFHAGGNDFVTKPVVEEVLISRIRSLLLIKKQFNQLKQQSEEMRRMATLDSLTGVHNRRHLLEKAGYFLASMHNYPAWVAVIDLDHFKSINDNYGHVIGDRVLQSVGGLLKEFFGGDDIIARSGGEEFVVLMKSRTRDRCAAEIEELRCRIETLRPAGVAVTASIGLAGTMGRVEIDFDHIVVEADQAMYRAKEAGRNRVVFFGPVPGGTGAKYQH